MNHFSIPIWGLKNGIHQFDFQVGDQFFNSFEDSVIKNGNFDVHLKFDKRAEMFVLNFDFEGNLKCECDRCLEEMTLPLIGSHRLVVKFAEEEREEEEVHYITKNQTELNVAKYIYEFLTIAMPIIKTHDKDVDENAVCNEEMLKYLSRETEEKIEDQNPFKDLMNKFKKN